MNEAIKKLSPWHYFFTLLLLGVFNAELKAENENSSFVSQDKQPCIAKEIKLASQQCVDLIRQSKLDTVKLSPQIRSKAIEYESSINLAELFPFTGGSAGGQVE